MFDAGLFLRTAGVASLTETTTGAGVAINRTPMVGLSCNVFIPKLSVGDTARVKLQHSTDDSTYTDLVLFETVASVTAARTTSMTLRRRFATELKYVRYEATVAGTSPDFGAVIVVIGDRDQWNTLAVGATASTAETL